MTDRYVALNDEIDRLRGDPDFERDVAETACAFGPPPGLDVVDDSRHFTAQHVDDFLADGKLREAAVMTAASNLPTPGHGRNAVLLTNIPQQEHPASERG